MKATLSLINDSIEITVNESILKKRPMFFAMEDWGAKVSESSDKNETSNIIISISLLSMEDYEKQNILKDIQDVFRGLGVSIQLQDNAKHAVSSMQEEEESFLRSCKAARDVWDGNLDIPEFSHFSQVIKEKISNAEFPDGLYEKQLLASYHIVASGSSCNFSVPGAGKTVNVWAAYAYLNSLPKEDPRHVNTVFVLGPNSCFEPWETEYSKCFGTQCKSIRFLPSLSLSEKRKILKGIIKPDHELYLCHFQTFSLYTNDFMELFKRSDKKIMFVVDEAHNIKGQDGVWANAALSIASLARSRIVLTGTPAPNGYEDLKNLFDFIHPNRNIIGFSRSELKLMSQGNKLSAKNLTERIKPFYIRIKKSDLNIPPPKFTEIPIEMSVVQEKVYAEIERKFINGQSTKLFKHGNLIRLMQAASNPMELLKPIDKEIYDGDIDDESANRILEVADYLKGFNSEKDLPKLAVLLDLAYQSENLNEKVIIWSYFIGNIKLIHAHLQTFLKCPIYVITGAVPMGDDDFNKDAEDEITRGKILRSFRQDIGASILIATPQCIGESISLHMECHKAIYYDRNFNCGMFIQSKDRIHRKGLPAGTITEYVYLNTQYSVDEQIHEALVKKENRMLKLVESEDIPLMTDNYEKEKEEDIKRVLDAYYAKQL